MGEVRLLVAFNPRSGRGKGVRAARAISAALGGMDLSGRRCRVISYELGPASRIDEALREADALAIAGGDGSVHHLAPAAAAAGVPIYHVPCGNENLLAREFRMDDSPETLARAIDAWRVERMDTAAYALGGSRGQFLLMCSFGPDASVIHRLASLRTKPLGHAAYIEPILRELVAPCYARLSVAVDGDRVVDHEPGVLLIANSRQYASRVDPAARASVSDGLLDVVFLPCSSRMRVLAWGLRSRLRRHEQHPDVVYRQGRSIEITANGEAVPFQLDGECPSCERGVLRGAMRIDIRPATLPVLVPPR